ncbi:hypothetical protein K438DRAFT_1800810 [Mycena galopus ATCC 62051]|nr:hypothetical protein K438DRAFT_1800810 [Mycena galopus ATCC 62051]
MLFWLRPSKQICTPLYSIKQRRQQRWIGLPPLCQDLLCCDGLENTSTQAQRGESRSAMSVS